MKKTNSISINILSVFVILICVFLTCVGGTNSWFTSHVNNVEILVDIGDLKLSVYQDINSVKTKLITNQEEAEKYDGPKSNYVVLNKSIAPDEEIDLILTLSNEDAGTSSMYIRYKLEVYSRGVDGDTLLDVNLNGYTEPSTEGQGQAGFVYDQASGWYYYKDKNSTSNALFAKDATASLMTSFTIPYSNFVETDGDRIITNSDTVYLKLIVDASVFQNFSEQQGG